MTFISPKLQWNLQVWCVGFTFNKGGLIIWIFPCIGLVFRIDQ